MALMAKSISTSFFWQRTLFVDPCFAAHACPNACTTPYHLAYLMEVSHIWFFDTNRLLSEVIRLG